jgi:hypothetical protein
MTLLESSERKFPVAGIGGCEVSQQAFGPNTVIPRTCGIRYAAASRFNHGCRWSAGSPHSTAQMRTKPVTTIACVAKWHSKFHAAARGIEATPLKK